MALDVAAAYEQTHQHLAELVRGLDDMTLAIPVPATPDWSVRDVIAHLTGVARDTVRGDAWDLYGAVVVRSSLPSLDARTSDQVAARKGTPIEALLEEWAQEVALVLPILRGDEPSPVPAPFADRMLVTDAATHAQDVRGALAMPGDRDSLGVSVAFSSYAGGLHLRLAGSGIPALRIAYGGKERVLGDGEPETTVRAERYELYRAMAGRRSRAQILAYDWHGDAEPYLPMIPAYGERADDLEE